MCHKMRPSNLYGCLLPSTFNGYFSLVLLGLKKSSDFHTGEKNMPGIITKLLNEDMLIINKRNIFSADKLDKRQLF